MEGTTARFTVAVNKIPQIYKMVTNVGISMAPEAYLIGNGGSTDEAEANILKHIGSNGQATGGYKLATPSQFQSDLSQQFHDVETKCVPVSRYIENYTGDVFTYNARLYGVPTGQGATLCAVPYVVYHIADTYRIVFGDMNKLRIP